MSYAPLPDRQYAVIYADPPWAYRDRARNRIGASRHYQTNPTDQIAALPVWAIAEPDCCLLMWATWPTMPDALAVIAGWGFTYKTCAFVWVKIYPSGKQFIGGGHYTRSNSEVVLLGVRGTPLDRASNGVRQIVETHEAEVIKVPHPRDDRGRIVHSAKPAVFRDRTTDLFGDVPRIELFARAAADGWDRWGNQAPEVVA